MLLVIITREHGHLHQGPRIATWLRGRDITMCFLYLLRYLHIDKCSVSSELLVQIHMPTPGTLSLAMKRCLDAIYSAPSDDGRNQISN